ncbi:hypothetical protein I302_108735 [Kwoniella bestiolae CBS 10118]|uniref:Transmembrane protein n=1 Tax=Kwoniella bestiolae CBS 10118 TaxID=1296100 RepID=A0A1B9FTX7_9TREE|nr:hypothetical protein I302_07872 [Kwoniella bestiolae CBS 10118]OCF22227.1 hypothetical protein I302_07872 [Kwoniella bestiolae CBS 10118]
MFPSLSLPLAHFLLLTFSFLLPTHAKEPFNITVSDQSPTISYFPSRSGPQASTWNVTYTDSAWSNYVNQTIGQGVSSHYTTFVGANASLGWWGTAVYLWGEGNDADIEVRVDGNTTAQRIEGGWYLDNLQESWHRLRVRVIGNGGVRIRGVTFTTVIGENGATPVNSTIQAIFGENQINGLFSSSTGQWETATLLGGAGNQTQQTYNRLDTFTPASRLIFQPPSNTSFIVLYGSVNFDHDQFFVSLTSSNLPKVATSGALEDTTTTTTTIGGIPSTQEFHGASPWVSTDQVLYYANLDVKSQYTVTVENQGQGRPYWDVSKVVFIQPQGGSAGGSSSNTAAIAGGVAGGVVVLTLIAGLLWFFIFRKKRDQRKRKQEANLYEDKPFEIDPYTPHGEQSAGDAYANAASGGHTPYDQTPPSGHHRDSTVTPLLMGSAGSPDPRSSYQSSGSYNPNRSSLPQSADGYGYYAPSSSVQTSQDSGGTPSGMVLHNPDQQNGRPTSASGPPGGAGKARYTNNRRRSNIIQEEDAGSVPNPPHPPQEDTVIPPSYNPSWAQARSRMESENGTS